MVIILVSASHETGLQRALETEKSQETRLQRALETSSSTSRALAFSKPEALLQALDKISLFEIRSFVKDMRCSTRVTIKLPQIFHTTLNSAVSVAVVRCIPLGICPVATNQTNRY